MQIPRLPRHLRCREAHVIEEGRGVASSENDHSDWLRHHTQLRSGTERAESACGD